MQRLPLSFVWPPVTTLRDGPATQAARKDVAEQERQLRGAFSWNAAPLLFRAATSGSRWAQTELAQCAHSTYWLNLTLGHTAADEALSFARALEEKLCAANLSDGVTTESVRFVVRDGTNRDPPARRSHPVPRCDALRGEQGPPRRYGAVGIPVVRELHHAVVARAASGC